MKVENRKKNQPPYKGPYEVLDIDHPNVDIQVNNKRKTVHKNILKKYTC